MDVVKDYDYEIVYHLGIANVVVDALRRKTTNTLIKGVFFKDEIDDSST